VTNSAPPIAPACAPAATTSTGWAGIETTSAGGRADRMRQATAARLDTAGYRQQIETLPDDWL
jgi:hypothetical protein